VVGTAMAGTELPGTVTACVVGAGAVTHDRISCCPTDPGTKRDRAKLIGATGARVGSPVGGPVGGSVGSFGHLHHLG
jgi:hypothetical protein